MTFSYGLVWFVGLSCVWVVLGALRSRGANRTWLLYPAGAILVATVAGYFLVPDWAGYAALGLWLLFLLVPARGFAWLNRLVDRGEYTKARSVSRWLRVLYPFTDWRALDQQLAAWEMAQRGRSAEGAELLGQRSASPASAAWTTYLQSYQMRGDWEGARSWIESVPLDDLVRRNPDILQAYLRALGETGDLQGLLQIVQRYRKGTDSASWSIPMYLITLAFGGRRDALERLLERMEQPWSPEVRALWLATADLAAGNEAAGRAQLETLQSHPGVGATARRRLTRGVARAETLTAEMRQFLDQLEQQLGRELAYARQSTPRRWATYVTYALIAANVAVFILELVLGADKDLWVLYDMGGMVPTVVLAGEWWRLVAAMFLHVNLVHLAMNMFVLYALGRPVESLLGWWRYLLLYLLSGLGSGLIVVALTQVGVLPVEAIYAGASGCILGLVGANGAIALRFWRKGRSRLAYQQVGGVVFIVVAQVLFSLVTPRVSLAAHLSGLAVGFLIASAFRYRMPEALAG